MVSKMLESFMYLGSFPAQVKKPKLAKAGGNLEENETLC